MRIFRFALSGGTSVGVYYSVLYLLVSKVGLHYLPSSLVAFGAFWVTNFSLHKYWTFGSREHTETTQQVIQHLGLTLGLLAGNTLGLYVLVEHAGLFYLKAQVLLSVVLSLISYLLMRSIFKTPR